jgi:UDP-N-acetylmuramoyl-tripeptide--D-alanyl-D-alanine ligase
MVQFDPSALCKWSKGNWNLSPPEKISGFTIDSRKVNQGDLFVALRAERDGHDFLNQAIAQGAVGGVVDHLVEGVSQPQLVVDRTEIAFQEIAKSHRKNFEGTVIGVTGSCGKTSTKEMLAMILPDSLSTDGNLNNHLGVPLTLCRLTTGSHKYAVVEAGINSVDEMQLLTNLIEPELTVITSVSHSHLQGLGTIEKVAEEKIKLWLGSDQCRLAIFPQALLEFKPFADAIQHRDDYIAVAREDGCLEPSENLVIYDFSTETNERGYSQNLKIKRCGYPPLVIRVPNVSEGMICNMVLAFVTAWKLGVSDREISERLPQYRPSGLRGTCLVGRGCSYVVDCYNANPASMLDSIRFFHSQFPDSPRLLVLGGMKELGEASDLLHKSTGSQISMLPSDHAIIIGEDARPMALGMIENGGNAENITVLPEPELARPLIEGFQGAVLIKGSRSYQLEDLIPFWAVEENEEMMLAC